MHVMYCQMIQFGFIVFKNQPIEYCNWQILKAILRLLKELLLFNRFTGTKFITLKIFL